jgi:hypothetical protein
MLLGALIMPPPGDHDDPFTTQETLDRLAALGEQLNRTMAEMRDLRERFLALAELESVTPADPHRKRQHDSPPRRGDQR